MFSRSHSKKYTRKCIFSSILGIGLVCFMIQTNKATAHRDGNVTVCMVILCSLIKIGKNYSLGIIIKVFVCLVQLTTAGLIFHGHYKPPWPL